MASAVIYKSLARPNESVYERGACVWTLFHGVARTLVATCVRLRVIWPYRASAASSVKG